MIGTPHRPIRRTHTAARVIIKSLVCTTLSVKRLFLIIFVQFGRRRDANARVTRLVVNGSPIRAVGGDEGGGGGGGAVETGRGGGHGADETRTDSLFVVFCVCVFFPV